MKIVFNTDQIYLHGGIEKVMATKANYFANLPGYDVVILTTEQHDKAACYDLDDRVTLIDLGIEYDRKKSYFSTINLKKIIPHFIKHKKMLNALQADVIISTNYNFDHYWLPFIKGKAKVIKEIHSSGYVSIAQRKIRGIKNGCKWKINDFIMGSYDSIVVLNIDEKRYQNSKNVVVIPNSIEISNKKAGLDNKLVIAAGRIAPVKGFDQLIEAWKIVHQSAPDWKLHIFGDAYLNTKEMLQKQIAKEYLEDVIVFKESVNNLPDTMLDYSIYAMSSVTECFPMVLLEALSVGLPVVSYDCPNGPRNIITNGNDGLLTENQVIKVFAEGLLSLIQDEIGRKKMGEEAKSNSKNFETKVVMQQWTRLFETLNTKNI